MEPSVAIILVNYNGYEDTIECVKSLLSIKYRNYRIYVVDNCSNDAEKIKADSFLNEKTTLMYTENNLGFSGGNNIAIRDALKRKFDYILLLNNDTTVEPEFLSALVNEAEKDSKIGGLTGKIYYYYRRESIWSAGGTYNRDTGLTIQFGGADDEQFDKRKEITFATGCLLMMPRVVIEKVGMMDEDYFLYSEDSDYCQRIIDVGYKIVYVPKSIIYHKVSASTGDNSPMQQRYMMRNNLYMIKKYSPRPQKAFLNLSWRVIKNVVKGRNNFKPTLLGYLDFFRGRKGMI